MSKLLFQRFTKLRGFLTLILFIAVIVVVLFVNIGPANAVFCYNHTANPNCCQCIRFISDKYQWPGGIWPVEANVASKLLQRLQDPAKRTGTGVTQPAWNVKIHSPNPTNPSALVNHPVVFMANADMVIGGKTILDVDAKYGHIAYVRAMTYNATTKSWTITFRHSNYYSNSSNSISKTEKTTKYNCINIYDTTVTIPHSKLIEFTTAKKWIFFKSSPK
jgi:hypothetical protein